MNDGTDVVRGRALSKAWRSDTACFLCLCVCDEKLGLKANSFPSIHVDTDSDLVLGYT